MGIVGEQVGSAKIMTVTMAMTMSLHMAACLQEHLHRGTEVVPRPSYRIAAGNFFFCIVSFPFFPESPETSPPPRDCSTILKTLLLWTAGLILLLLLLLD